MLDPKRSRSRVRLVHLFIVVGSFQVQACSSHKAAKHGIPESGHEKPDGGSELEDAAAGSRAGDGALGDRDAAHPGDKDATSASSCSADCGVEPSSICGDGVLQEGERCDEGSFADSVGCSEDCTRVDPHYSCPEPGAACVLCGDGIVEGKEVCDDGNTVSGDGCVFSCFATEPGWLCNKDGGGCSICGDGIVDAALEACDDGNFQSNDGCSAECVIEPGAVCFQEGVLCAVCGNGYIEAVSVNAQGQVTLEECDDGNLIAGDGCSSGCKRDPAFQCPLAGVECNKCGDGVVQGIERCDDHNTLDGDGCSSDCTAIAAHYNCFTPGDACVLCGNGTREAGEACDDGNTLGGDGCARDCRSIDSGYRCETNSDGSFVGCAKCGDGILELDEVCDDHNALDGDGCSADCRTIASSYNCAFVGYPCVQCGNGVLEPGEQCDEGSVKTAGCSAQCQVVVPWVCPVAGQPCELCGDHQLGLTESCDDGNVASGDGCSSTCEMEPGYECTTGTCLAAACGDGARAGNEQCDDGNQLSGDGCSTVCTLESGWVCTPLGCHRTVCGDSVIEGGEHCDDGNAVPLDGCDAKCQLEATYKCPDPGQPCTHTLCGDGFVEGLEQCDDGGLGTGDGCDGSCKLEPNYACVAADKKCHGGTAAGMPCTSELSCEGGDCSATDETCHTTTCGDGVVEGSEQCDDGGKSGICRGGAQDGASCANNAACTGGGSCVDGCTACKVDTFYRCTGSPSVCRPILDFAAIRRFNVSNVDPDGLVYDPLRRSFAGHKRVDSQKPIELCLDGSVINPNDTSAGPNGTIYLPDGSTQAVANSYLPPPRPTTSATLLEAAYDPFTGHDLYLTSQGGTVVLTEVSLCTVQNCPPGNYYQAGVDNIVNFQAVLTGAGGAEGLTVGEDGDLYVTDDTAKTVYVFARRRDVNQNIVVPHCAQTPDPNGDCTSFASSPTGARSFAAPTTDVLDAIFTVPGEGMVGLFNKYSGATSYTGIDAQAGTTYTSSEYFSFYQPSLGTNPPLYGRSALPGLLFDLGGIGQSYTKYAQSAETASDGGSFILCPNNPSEDCQLFARVCQNDADCAAIVPGTRCNLTAPVPYCSSRGEARDDYAKVQRNSSGNVIDVLANDSRSESSCRAPEKKVINLKKGAGGSSGSSITTVEGGSVTITHGGGDVTYTAPSGACGFVDQFDYDAALGGGVVGSATVRVLVVCVCGDGVRDPNEQCDLGNADGPPPSRCSTSCTINVVCGDGFVDPGEACDDHNTLSGDGCSARCTLESVCGDGVVEGVEECDDHNTVSGDLCNWNCIEPICGDGSVDVQSPFLEQCDLGLNNSNGASSTCSTLCKVIAHCGDGQVEIGEQCDDGNVLSGDGCSSLCTVEGKCGNAVLDGGEECDPAIQTTQCGGKASCGSFCFCNNYCGDGRVGGSEQCDDGNAVDGDGCRSDCTAEVCGDGIVDPGEQCDDGNNVSTDKCTNGCMLIAICGDHVLDSGEQCDDGNQVSGDGCSATCKLETGVCGNGKLEGGEQCDDGNTVAGDGCSPACLLEVGSCGDGRLDVGEQCDDGNTVAGDGCDASCRFEGCGDGVKVAPEQCDDGNRTNHDGCDSNCNIEVL